jgi:hypothetical protein
MVSIEFKKTEFNEFGKNTPVHASYDNINRTKQSPQLLASL